MRIWSVDSTNTAMSGYVRANFLICVTEKVWKFGSKAPHIQNDSNRCRWTASFMFHLLYTRGKIHRCHFNVSRGGGLHIRSGILEKKKISCLQWQQNTTPGLSIPYTVYSIPSALIIVTAILIFHHFWRADTNFGSDLSGSC